MGLSLLESASKSEVVKARIILLDFHKLLPKRNIAAYMNIINEKNYLPLVPSTLGIILFLISTRITGCNSNASPLMSAATDSTFAVVSSMLTGCLYI